jgi:hypothetical protein
MSTTEPPGPTELLVRDVMPPATDLPTTQEDQVAAYLKEADSWRRPTGLALIGLGVVALATVGGAGFFALHDAVLEDVERMGTDGYPYLVGARALFGASLVGGAAALVRSGQTMLLPSSVVRDIQRRTPIDGDEDEITAFERMVGVVQKILDLRK